MQKINRKEVDGIIKATFPDYKGRKVYVQCDYIPKSLDSYWNEGHRDYFSFYNMADGRTYLVHSNHPGFEPNQPRNLSSLPLGVLLVRRTYSGCNQYVTIFCNPEDMPKQITS